MQRAAGGLLLVLLGLLAATATAVRLGGSSGNGGGFGTGNAFAPPSPTGRRRASAFQSLWLPTPLRQRHQQQQGWTTQEPAAGPRRRPSVTVMNDGGKQAGGLLKNLQGLFRPGAASKPAKAVRLPTIQELHHALASPEPGTLMTLMEVRFSVLWLWLF